MHLSQIIEALPLQAYVRRGELVIHFSTIRDVNDSLPAILARIYQPNKDRKRSYAASTASAENCCCSSTVSRRSRPP